MLKVTQLLNIRAEIRTGSLGLQSLLEPEAEGLLRRTGPERLRPHPSITSAWD